MRDEGEARAAKWLAAWDAQGIHRTATAGDEAGADWLIYEVAALGIAAPACEEFALRSPRSDRGLSGDRRRPHRRGTDIRCARDRRRRR